MIQWDHYTFPARLGEAHSLFNWLLSVASGDCGRLSTQICTSHRQVPGRENQKERICQITKFWQGSVLAMGNRTELKVTHCCVCCLTACQMMSVQSLCCEFTSEIKHTSPIQGHHSHLTGIPCSPFPWQHN